MLIKKIKKSMSQINANNDYEKLTFIKNELDRLRKDVDKLDIRVNQYVNMNNILKDYLKNNNDLNFKETKYINNQISTILHNINDNDFSNYELIKNIELSF